MRVRRQASFILRTLPYSESSLIIDVFSRAYGRIFLLAKGARRAKSRLRGNLRVCSPLEISWYGKGNVPVLTQVVLKSAYVRIEGEIIYSSSYLNELLLKLLHLNDPYPVLFDEYSHALDNLINQVDTFYTLRVFEKVLLKELGYALVLTTEADHSTPIDEDKNYTYDFDSGPKVSRKKNALTVQGRTLAAIDNEQFNSVEIRKEVKKFLNRAIVHRLDGKQLKTRGVYRQTLDPKKFG